jgi:hypothetical protein
VNRLDDLRCHRDRCGHGGLFDEILLNTQGLGNDPYEFASFRIQKNGLYRYDMLWRLNEYYNPALTLSEGRHFRDTSRRMQDHDLILGAAAEVGRARTGRGDRQAKALHLPLAAAAVGAGRRFRFATIGLLFIAPIAPSTLVRAVAGQPIIEASTTN